MHKRPEGDRKKNSRCNLSPLDSKLIGSLSSGAKSKFQPFLTSAAWSKIRVTSWFHLNSSSRFLQDACGGTMTAINNPICEVRLGTGIITKIIKCIQTFAPSGKGMK